MAETDDRNLTAPAGPTAAASDWNPDLENGRAVDVARGWAWIVEGFQIFRRQAGIWILLALIFLVLMLGMQLVPVIGPFALMLLLPVLVAGLIDGCRTIARGGELELAHLFAGFRRNTGQLVLLGVIAFALTTAAMIPLVVLMGSTGFHAVLMGNSPALGPSFVLSLLIVLALLVPVNMALWFAPALVMLQSRSATKAVAASFKGALKNIVPFLLYGIVLFILAMIASIPFGLGWLVLLPIVLGSIYAAYRDIYAPAG